MVHESGLARNVSAPSLHLRLFSNERRTASQTQRFVSAVHDRRGGKAAALAWRVSARNLTIEAWPGPAGRLIPMRARVTCAPLAVAARIRKRVEIGRALRRVTRFAVRVTSFPAIQIDCHFTPPKTGDYARRTQHAKPRILYEKISVSICPHRSQLNARYLETAPTRGVNQRNSFLFPFQISSTVAAHPDRAKRGRGGDLGNTAHPVGDVVP